MERYKNLRGNSGVTSYDFLADSITVQSNDGSVYLYNYMSAGRSNIETMKELATSGYGLNSFIMRHVKKGYAVKLR